MLADRLLRHALSFSLKAELPPGVEVLDPFRGEHAPEVRRIVRTFHRRFYSDEHPRLLMLGINPGRLGAGSTGLPFTDTKRCESDLGIPVKGFRTHEPSSDFFYRMLRAAGGSQAFFSKVYVHAVCPLGFTTRRAGRAINLNYYDDPALQRAVTPFIRSWLRALLETGMRSDLAFCLGIGKNFSFLEKLNAEARLFGRIVPLPHPRFIMQYRSKQLRSYLRLYTRALEDAAAPDASAHEERV
jgi:hypothetical protein